MKHDGIGGLRVLGGQPPSGGCVLKQLGVDFFDLLLVQPPSGGCVLKQAIAHLQEVVSCPAAFRRLCVETEIIDVDVKDVIYASRLQAAVC